MKDEVQCLAKEVSEKPWKYASIGSAAYGALVNLSAEVIRLSKRLREADDLMAEIEIDIAEYRAEIT